MKRSIRMCVLGVSAAFLTVMPAMAKGNTIQVKGSDTMVNLAQAWAEDFMGNRQGAFVAVTGGGSGTGLAALIGGTCDLAISSREIKAKEIELARKKKVEPKEFKVALDGLAVVVSPSNPVSKLTMAQLAGIFTGKITDWSQVGGTGGKIVVLSREVNSGTHVYFKEHVLRGNDPASREEFSPEALLLPSSQAIADEISQNSGAIGYYGMGYISPKQKALHMSKDDVSDAVAPTVDNVISGQYPISRPLLVYTNGEPLGAVKDFIDFILSPEGQKVVAKIDFVPIK